MSYDSYPYPKLARLMFAPDTGGAVGGLIRSTPTDWTLAEVQIELRASDEEMTLLQQLKKLKPVNGIIPHHEFLCPQTLRNFLVDHRLKQQSAAKRAQHEPEFNPDKWKTTAEWAATMPHPRGGGRTLDAEILDEQIANKSLEATFAKLRGAKLVNRSDLRAFIGRIGGQTFLDRMQLARDSRVAEAEHAKLRKREKERAEQESADTVEQKKEAAGLLPWKTELRELEEQRELAEIRRRVAADNA